jgi:hypothetical protein
MLSNGTKSLERLAMIMLWFGNSQQDKQNKQTIFVDRLPKTISLSFCNNKNWSVFFLLILKPLFSLQQQKVNSSNFKF